MYITRPQPAAASGSDRTTRIALWSLRGLWVALPFAAGPAFSDALDGASTPVRTVASVGLWLAWAVVVVAALVPRPVGLTALRVVAPASLVAPREVAPPNVSALVD